MSNRPPANFPGAAFVQTLRVRSYEVESSGRIALGTILRYLESLATEASAALGFDTRWYERHNSAWVVREMTVWLGSLPGIGDQLVLATWVSDFRRVQAQREYLIRQQDSGRLVTRASARWAYIDRRRGQPTRLPDDLVSSFPVPGQPMPVAGIYAPTAEDLPAIRGEMLLTAREYETDTQQHINNCVYGDWLAEAARRTLDTAMAPSTIRRLRPRSYQIEYVRPALAAAEMRIETAIYTHGAHGIHARQAIVRVSDGGLCVRARSDYLRLLR
jgi:acyl-CoA thioesterase FadM